MARLSKTTTPNDRFDHLLKVIMSERFLKKQGLGNEVPFFIFPYPAEEAVGIDAMRTSLVKQLENRGVRVVEINLYDLSISLLHDRGIWDDVLVAEPSIGKDELKELLQGVLDPETHLIPAIGAILAGQQFDVLFLSGVGEVYPYIRSHNVLNNLQSTAKEKPTVMFFPGKYTHSLASGASLDLFGTMHDDKYYRAFDITHYEI
ncbi:DUF1788 domain-containing protein [Rhizobium sp. 22-785-1]